MRKSTGSLITIPGNTRTITQVDLEQMFLLQGMYEEARERYIEKYAEIRSALKAGARVEPGIHDVSFVLLRSAWDECGMPSYEKLVVR